MIEDWREKKRRELAEKIQGDTEAYEKAGVRRWRSNDAVIPPDIYKDAGLECSAVHLAAYKAETEKFLAEYRERMKNHVPDAEELFEMRAAFGTNTTVVDVVTGRKTRL